MTSVIIIGAGAAGIAAAARLCEKGFDSAQITILEAQDRIGGRIHTVHHGNPTSDLSMQFFINDVIYSIPYYI